MVCNINITVYSHMKRARQPWHRLTRSHHNPRTQQWAKGRGTRHTTGWDNHNSNTLHALHLFASPWPPFNGIGVIVNLKHKGRLKAILSGTARKEREGRKEGVRKRTTVRKGSHNTKGTRMLQFRLTTPYCACCTWPLGLAPKSEKPPCARNNLRYRDCQSRTQPELCTNQIRLF